MITAILALLRGVPVTWLVGGLLVAAALGWHALEKRKAYNAGWNDALATVRKMDERAAEVAREAQTAVDACFDKGGTWDAISASCRL